MTDESLIKPEVVQLQELQRQIAEGAQDRTAQIDAQVADAGLVGPRDQIDEVGAALERAGLTGAVLGNREIDRQIARAFAPPEPPKGDDAA